MQTGKMTAFIPAHVLYGEKTDEDDNINIFWSTITILKGIVVKAEDGS